MFRRKKIRGFTLVEVLLATAILALMAGGFATLYTSGLNSLVSQKDRGILNSTLSSRMEELKSRLGDEPGQNAGQNGDWTPEVFEELRKQMVIWALGMLDEQAAGNERE